MTASYLVKMHSRTKYRIPFEKATENLPLRQAIREKKVPSNTVTIPSSHSKHSRASLTPIPHKVYYCCSPLMPMSSAFGSDIDSLPALYTSMDPNSDVSIP